jgi:hypothetical protein
MHKSISLDRFQDVIALLDSLRRIGLLAPASFIVVWERRPKLTMNALGCLEFMNPQEVYGVTIRFWGKRGNKKVETNCRYVLTERFSDV